MATEFSLDLQEVKIACGAGFSCKHFCFVEHPLGEVAAVPCGDPNSGCSWNKQTGQGSRVEKLCWESLIVAGNMK